ncbi:hypothetical protein AJ80_09407 [Polytolypa hystricis UAMH7299]|uniref:Chitin synthesis regulation, resistance to congo red-domain-containing protein n=1 Tax=Polytolypa hystricis (strain UAMH7299) TaxID=1447883 RepID=A0A2B7WQP5_POLH7|nr:hypothetical protein AJ80_09407 [Polytolypa hystricis UAMH7299]
MAILARAVRCEDNFGNRVSCSTWHGWGRWVALAVLVGAAFLCFFAFACLSSRRRRRAGRQPFRGTGWAAGPHPPHPPPQYQPPPPQYTAQNGYYPPNQHQGHGENQGYFGGQQSGVELQPPQNAYQPVYAPPPGPPPNKQ